MYTYVILDDNRTIVSALHKLIEDSPLPLVKVGEAYDGLNGLVMVRQEQPDVILTDIKMPGYDGLQLIGILREETVNSRFLIISGYGSFEYAREAIKLGVSDFLLKPVSEDELIAALGKLVAELDAERGSFEKQAEQPAFSPRIAEAIRIIHQRIDEPVSLTDVSDALGITASHLSRSFKKETGMGFNAYVTKQKMEEARRLLRNPQNKAHEVARMLGYHDYTYFFQVFKKTFGYSPKDERSKMNEAQ